MGTLKSGVVPVYKEKGYTSFDVVARLRGVFGIKKIGHTGTLDPDATGVLPICVGKATRLCETLSHKDKEYEASLLLGMETDTQDISGTVIEKRPVNVTEQEIRTVINSFVGDLNQIPPMYSAKKIDGRKLYELAREGKTVDRKPNKIRIYSIDILGIEIPRVHMRVRCSTGTYIRTLCTDIGRALGTLGTMESLLRTEVDRFKLEDCLRIDEIKEMLLRGEEVLSPVDEFFSEYKRVDTKGSAGKILENGGFIPISYVISPDRDEIKNSNSPFRVYHPDGRFVGIFVLKGDGLKPLKMYLE